MPQVGIGGAITVNANTERWLSEIRAGRAFQYGATAAAEAAKYSHLQLINPAGSGVTVLVFDAVFVVDTAGGLTMHRYDTALTTDVAAGVNLLAGGAAAAAHVRSHNQDPLLGTLMGTWRALADTPISAGPWIIELGAGEGILFVPAALNRGMTVTFRWIEE